MIDDTLSNLIKQFEGFRVLVYDDANGALIAKGSAVEGNPTIGWGRCLSTHGITVQEAEMMLENDIADCGDLVIQALPWVARLSEARQNVFICMAFQMGIVGLLEFKIMLAAAQQGKFDQAGAAMLQSKWADETPNRAKILANMMIEG